MRLYGKLLLIVLSFAFLQAGLRDRGEDWWFAARCHIAKVTGDDAMQECLIEEGRRELCRNLERSLDSPQVVVAGQ